MLTKKHILDEEFVPERDIVVHRRDKLERLMEPLRPQGIGPSDLLYLIGPTGTGKTMLAKLTFDLFEEDRQMPPFKFSYINCWSHTERRDVLFKAVSDLRHVAIHRNATGQAELIGHLTDEDPDYPQYVVLDEADQLHDKDVLYDLHNAPNLHVILIANREEDLFAHMDDRVQSRLRIGRRIECESYSASQLAAILRKRAKHALGWPGRNFTEQQLEFIAANADGDARIAIRTLRVAAEMSGSKLTDEAIEDAFPMARDQLRKKSREQLLPHQVAVLEVIEEAESPLSTGDVVERYQKCVEDHRTKRRVRTYLSKLEQYNHIKSVGRDSHPEWVARGAETE